MPRLSAILPVVLCTGALVLSFLCLFAGRKTNFMQSYDVLTLNASRIGTNLLGDDDLPFDGSNPLTEFINNQTSDVFDNVNEAVGSLAERIGVEDFYTAHILNYCWGTYTPQPVPNATVDDSDIHRRTEACSPIKAMFYFDPTDALKQSLNASGANTTLSELQWPDAIQDGINALRLAARATFILYCIGIGLTFLALLGSLMGLFATGRLAAAVVGMLSLLAFLSLAVASSIATAFAVKGSSVINKYGREIGVEADRGNKFLAITWAATGAMFLATLLWSISCCVGHRSRRNRAAYNDGKMG